MKVYFKIFYEKQLLGIYLLHVQHDRRQSTHVIPIVILKKLHKLTSSVHTIQHMMMTHMYTYVLN